MSDLFSLYEDNLNQVMNQLRIITSTFSTLSRDKAESAITNGASLIKEGEKILRQMELEISSNNTLTGMNALTAKVKNYKNEFQNLKYTFEKIQTNYISKKAENAIFLGTEDNTEHKVNQNIELIENEENNNSKEHEEKVEVRDIFDAKGEGHLGETIPDEALQLAYETIGDDSNEELLVKYKEYIDKFLEDIQELLTNKMEDLIDQYNDAFKPADYKININN